MTSSGVIPLPQDRCKLCHGTGWVTLVDHDGSGYDTACPNGCPTTVQPLDDNAEVPF